MSQGDVVRPRIAFLTVLQLPDRHGICLAMDPIVEKAQDDLRALQERLARLEAEADQVRAEMSALGDFLQRYSRYSGVKLAGFASIPPLKAVGQAEVRRAYSVSTNASRALKPGTVGANIAEKAAEEIQAARRPMSITELLKAVQEKYEIGGQRPATNLSSILSRSDKVHFVHGVGWTLVDPETKLETDTAAQETKAASTAAEDAA